MTSINGSLISSSSYPRPSERMDEAASKRPENALPSPSPSQAAARTVTLSAATPRQPTSTLRRLASLPAMRMTKQQDPVSRPKPEEPGQVVEPERTDEARAKAAIDKEQTKATLLEAAKLVQEKIETKYSVRLPVSMAEKLIILKYATLNVWSRKEIARRINTVPARPPTPPGEPQSSGQAKDDFLRRKADRQREMEAKRLWEEGLAEEPPTTDFDDIGEPELTGDDAIRASLEDLVRLSGDGHSDVAPLALSIANAPEVHALLSEHLQDWSQAPMRGSSADGKRRVRKTRSSVELRAGAGSADAKAKGSAGGPSGSRVADDRARYDPRYPDAPPVPPLSVDKG